MNQEEKLFDGDAAMRYEFIRDLRGVITIEELLNN